MIARFSQHLICKVAIASALLSSCSPWESRSRVDAEIAAIDVALVQFKNVFGHYPGGNTAEIGLALNGANPKKKVFIELRSSEEGLLLDPWGRPYRIKFTKENNPIIASFGSDGRPSPDDITSQK